MSVGISTPFPTGHGGYDYNFIRIPKGKSYRGKLVIHGSTYGGEDNPFWRVQVTFGYVENAVGINRKLMPREDPAKLQGELASRLKVIWLSNLRVDTLK